MNTKVLIAGAAIAVMATGAVSAKTSQSASGGAYAAPSQPIPYGQLDSYMKASPRQRAAMSANSAGADTSATATSSSSSMGAGSAPEPNGMSSAPGSNGSMAPSATPGGSMSNDTTAPSTSAMTPATPAATDPMTPPK